MMRTLTKLTMKHVDFKIFANWGIQMMRTLTKLTIKHVDFKKISNWGIQMMRTLTLTVKHVDFKIFAYWGIQMMRTLTKLHVNQCQNLSFLNQLTHNLTRDCSLNSQKNTSSEHVVYKYCFECQKKKKCTQHVLNMYFSRNSMNNLLSYCGITDARMRASEKDLPVTVKHVDFKNVH